MSVNMDFGVASRQQNDMKKGAEKEFGD